MTPGRTAPEGSCVTPVNAPVEAVWLHRFLEETSAMVSDIKSRHRLRPQSRWRLCKPLFIDDLARAPCKWID